MSDARRSTAPRLMPSMKLTTDAMGGRGLRTRPDCPVWSDPACPRGTQNTGLRSVRAAPIAGEICAPPLRSSSLYRHPSGGRLRVRRDCRFPRSSETGNARNRIRRPGDDEAMPCEVHFTEDASDALSTCEPYLISRPVEHNVVLTVLRRRATDPTEGRYWWIDDEGAVVGFAMQSPLSFHGAITPMTPSATQSLVDVVSETVPDLPGVASDAASAASFAGNWAERLRIPVTPVEAQRIYRLVALHPPEGVPGRFRPAEDADRDTLVAHRVSFHTDTREPGELDAAAAVERSLRRCFVWDDGGVVASAVATIPEAGVVRVGVVYTPPEHRRRGYASALVAATSAWAREQDHSDCILYTQLANPTSNAIYRAIGYQPVAEVLRYRFG